MSERHLLSIKQVTNKGQKNEVELTSLGGNRWKLSLDLGIDDPERIMDIAQELATVGSRLLFKNPVPVDWDAPPMEGDAIGFEWWSGDAWRNQRIKHSTRLLLEDGPYQGKWHKRAFFKDKEFKRDLLAWIMRPGRPIFAKLGRITGIGAGRLRYYLRNEKASNLSMPEIMFLFAYTNLPHEEYFGIKLSKGWREETRDFYLNGMPMDHEKRARLEQLWEEEKDLTSGPFASGTSSPGAGGPA